MEGRVGEAGPEVAVARGRLVAGRAHARGLLPLGRELRDAQHRAVGAELPAVVAAGEAAVLVEALGELGGAVAAAVVHDRGRARAVQPQHEVAAEEAEGLRPVRQHRERHERIPEALE